ncbi:beta-lactamase family protein [Streptomyces sp. LX-29]|uniref:serine hydrolase domain-containing protein n=1 Tax=Streptomyces sp. LX-29 TaxID=2900152 RepID=UPI00240D2859|nr:serine hydrolase domain-containing protein [Streptomyces sp. LX-29]WFB07881.1 beta-lactamase family protein [Streptomyces sp. LX-29]
MQNRNRALRVAAAVLALVLAATASGCGAAVEPRDGRDGDRGEGRVAAALRRMVTEGPAPGGAVLTAVGGRARFAAAGTADLRTGRPVGRTDRFRAGSLTKTFLATVVLQLAAERRLGLEDTVEAHLPGLVRGRGNDGRKVTVRQLLSHTSGLYDYTRDPAFARRAFGADSAGHRLDTHAPRALVRTALAHPPSFAPGDGWRYSNTNYLLLGLIVEQVTGHPYAAEVRRRVILPLGLTGTSLPGTRAALPAPHGRAYSARAGADTGSGAPRDVTELDPSVAGAAGELVSTLDDLARFFGALLDGRLLPGPQLRAMRDTAASDGRYGLGLYPVRLPCGVTVWGHNGVISGSYALVVGAPGGRRVLAYRLNDDARPARTSEGALLRAEFCPPGA